MANRWAEFLKFETWKPKGHEKATSWKEVRIIDGTRETYEDCPLLLTDNEEEAKAAVPPA